MMGSAPHQTTPVAGVVSFVRRTSLARRAVAAVSGVGAYALFSGVTPSEIVEQYPTPASFGDWFGGQTGSVGRGFRSISRDFVWLAAGVAGYVWALEGGIANRIGAESSGARSFSGGALPSKKSTLLWGARDTPQAIAFRNFRNGLSGKLPVVPKWLGTMRYNHVMWLEFTLILAAFQLCWNCVTYGLASRTQRKMIGAGTNGHFDPQRGYASYCARVRNLNGGTLPPAAASGQAFLVPTRPTGEDNNSPPPPVETDETTTQEEQKLLAPMTYDAFQELVVALTNEDFARVSTQYPVRCDGDALLLLHIFEDLGMLHASIWGLNKHVI